MRLHQRREAREDEILSADFPFTPNWLACLLHTWCWRIGLPFQGAGRAVGSWEREKGLKSPPPWWRVEPGLGLEHHVFTTPAPPRYHPDISRRHIESDINHRGFQAFSPTPELRCLGGSAGRRQFYSSKRTSPFDVETHPNWCAIFTSIFCFSFPDRYGWWVLLCITHS